MMKPKKQQPASVNEKKPFSSGAASGPVTLPSVSGTEAKSTLNASSSSSTTAPAKKPIKRLQAKTKESTPNVLTTGSGVANTNTSPATGAGKATEKLLTGVQQIANQQQTVSSKSKSSTASIGKSKVAAALANASKTLAVAGTSETSKSGTKVLTTESLTSQTSSSCSTAGPAAGKSETLTSSSGKGNKHTQAIKPDSVNQPTPQNPNSTVKGNAKDTTERSKKPAKEPGSASKRSAGQTAKSDSGKRKQSSTSCNPSPVCTVASSGEGRPGATGIPLTSSSIDSKLREKEKKIQKELKNLGVPDKTINQSIDAAYLLESAVESVVNPSISEMVKTKSRTTVAQGKYGGGGGDSGAVGMARKSSITSEEGADGETEKSAKESISGNTGKLKKSVTLKVDRQSADGSKKMSGKVTSAKETSEKLASKAARKDDKLTGGSSTSGGVSGTSAKSSSAKATGQGAKSSKKANNSSGSAEPKQKKSGVAELAPKGTEQQKKDLATELPAVKQSADQEGALIIGRGSSIEQEDHEEKNEEVHIRIDSIVKALEREDIETPSGTKKESDAEARTGELADVAIVTPPVVATNDTAPIDGKTKKQPTPRKPPAKKEGSSMAASKSKAKETSEKKKATVTDQASKKEVKFEEQTPASPAKRKYVKKPKAGTTDDTATGEKPAKMAKSVTTKKAAATSKAKQINAKTNSKTQTVPAIEMDGATSLTDSSKDDKAVDTPAAPEAPAAAAASTINSVPNRDRSSTENDDDVPLRQLQQKQTSGQPATELCAVLGKDKPSTITKPSTPQHNINSVQDQTTDKGKEDRSNIGSEINVPSSATGPILAGLLKSSGKQGKRSYVRKNATSGGSGKNSKVPPVSGPCAVSATVTEECHLKERKMEKKDVYDFDDSESEVEAPVKSGKPSFKRKSSVDISQSREDISRDALEDSQSIKQKVDDDKKEETPTVHDADSVDDKEKCNDEDETAKRTVPLKKQKRRIEAALSESVALPKKEQRGGESSDSEVEQNDDADPDAPEMKVKKKATALTKKLKQEAKEDTNSSADEADDDDEAGADDAEEDENNESGDSDGCSSTDTVRTRIVKKRQSAKKRNVKLYGFWSGPKRHRVASLNALAKVHCLYENEMRGALEASLMSQSSGSRVIRTITKDGERIKKERICPDEESAGEESRSGETISGEMPEHGKGKEPEQGKGKDLERKESDKKREDKKDSMKQERKEAPSQQQKQTDGAAREEVKPKVKEEAPKKDSDQDSAESSEEEPVVMRNLRYVPGLRGAGKHWDPDASSLESEIEQLPDSDETYAQGKDTDPTRKRKVKKKVVRKGKAKAATVQAKTEKIDKDKEKPEKGSEKPEKPPKPPVKKIKKELKALMTDNERQDDGTVSSSSTGSEKVENSKAKPEEGVKKRKREPKSEKVDTAGDYKDYIGKKRMASLNATAMLAATYEVQRVLYRNTDSSDSECSAEKVPKTKKGSKDSKDQKETVSKESAASANKIDVKEKKETTGEKELRDAHASQHASASSSDSKHLNVSTLVEPTGSNTPAALSTVGSITVAQQETLTKKKKVVIKTEPMRDRRDDQMEVKREIEEPRPVSSNLVIAQDTEVTITGVYVNSSLGANQEAYCKMQYRVQQSVTEERLVRPGEAPPKSYTPLSALSSMRPPNDQTLSTPPLFVPPAQCDSPLGPPRAFYPPPTSSSGSSSAFCAPMPHDSPGYYQPAGPLISPHLLGQPPSQHGPKSGPDGETLLQSPQQPPASSTADSTDSDVLLTGGGVDLGHRSQPYGASRYGPAPGSGGPPGNLYPRPMQMHCPPTYLSPGYYAPSPYGPQPPPPHGPPPEMYYTHAYPPHYYPKFAPPYYPTSRRYYAGPGPGPEHHLYEQAPPPSSAQGPPGPPPPPSGAQLVPAGPQGPQHLDHYPYPPYPGYGSPGPGSGGQCYPRNLQHPPPPPAYMDAHYTTNCPCPMQCPKNVNAGSLIGIKASKGPVATNNHIVQNQPGTRISTTEPITISSSSSSASSSSSPTPVDSPVTTSATTSPVRQTLPESESSPNAASKQQPHPSHGYHAHHHHGSPLQMEMHPPGAPTHHPHTYPYHFHHHHPSPLHHSPHGPIQAEAVEKTTVTATSTSAMTTLSSTTKHAPAVVTTAATGSDANHPDKVCYKTELPIKPESVTELLSTPMHYGSPYHHPYHHPIGYYHHAKLSDLKEEQHGTLTPPYSISSKMKLLETPEMSPVRVSTVLNATPVLAGEILQPSLKATECGDKTLCTDEDKLTTVPVSTAIVKQEIEEFKLLEPLDGTVCKKEDFEETGPAMTPDLLDESIVIKKDRDEVKPITRTTCHPEHQGAHPHASVDQHHLHHYHHMQQMHVATHLPHHLHHHSASTNLLHGTPQHHHLHSHYSMQRQHQQQPLITGLLVEKDDVETNAKLPPDSKSLLTELVLTTEASMVQSPKKTTQSILTTSSAATEMATALTTKSAEDVSARTDVTNDICNSPRSQQPRGNSSDNSFSLSDSLTPSVAGAPEQLSSISKNIVKVQSHDSSADSLDPPSPVPIPASTVKRRPLLVACKKPTPKHSPPNSYKNLIKRTNGLEGEDGHQPQCPEPVELSEEEEEEDEEDDEEEEDNYEEEEDEDVLQDEQIEDVEDIELQEQRKVEIEKIKPRQPGEPLTSSRSHKQSVKKRLAQRKLSADRRKKGCKRNLLRSTSETSHIKQHRRQLCFEAKKITVPTVVNPERARSVRRYYRVFRSSIESLKRLPVSIRKRLLRRTNITLLPMRRSAPRRPCKSQRLSPEAINDGNDVIHVLVDTQTSQPVSDNSTDIVKSENNLPNKSEQHHPSTESLVHEDSNNDSVNKINESAPIVRDINTTMQPLSNVDRTIDLVAKGYFSEPEILNGTEVQAHSRAWLKKLKQQQEGRSHSEQSRGAKSASDQKSEGSTKKCKSKCSSLVLNVSASHTTNPITKDKKPKSKSSKHTHVVGELQLEASLKAEKSAECKEGKSKKKTSSKESKKDQSSRKRKQKELNGENDDSHAHKRSNPSVEMIKADESLYQRATSTPISVPIGEVSLVSGHDDREEDGRKGGAVIFDDSVVTLMDHSSVLDDRETDFDDAATMLVEDDVASVDTNVLVNRHNNNNNSAVTDKNNMEQQRIAADQLVLAAPIQAIIAEGKEGSELEPPEGMEPFMDEQLDEDEVHTNVQLAVSNHLSEQLHPTTVLPQPQQCPPAESCVEDPPALGMHLNYDDDYEDLEEEELLPKRGSSRSVKRRRSRSKTKSKKFSTKKRHRPSTHRTFATEIEELIVPKKCTTIPRWSNGWTWEGQPFQGKVFLNSDDPPVLRTCYPAMRHSVGDIIKPRDCVLLKAGSKRAELPYVAKVAHLWENPDDGEMMMSLLWYYRPEHTEQGRQRTDGPDEVFASRHKDHNSVACIEDKCYVLTFSEYCRFRRQLKGYEENIEEQPSIVPPLRRENPRLPPPIVSPELVMYCQRVYEFRQKRLLKSTS